MTELTPGPVKDRPARRSNPVDGKEPAVSKHSRELIEFCIQDTRYSLILDMLAHPEQMPSFEELRRANANRSPSTLSGHLDKLVEMGIVNRFNPPAGERSGSSPRNFYALSDEGYTFLDHYNLLPEDEERLQAQYAGVEKPDEIEQLENYPRDNLVVDGSSVDSTERRLLRAIVEQYPEQNEESQRSADGSLQESADSGNNASGATTTAVGNILMNSLRSNDDGSHRP